MKKLFLLIILVAGVIAFALPAQATSLEFSLDTSFPGSDKPDPDGSGPWLTVVFDDQDSPGTVFVTLSADLKYENIVTEWYVNIDPIITPSDLTFTYIGGTAPSPNAITVGDQNEQKADGDGWYDILFDFPPPPGDLVFDGNEYITYLISYDNLTASSFAYQSMPGGGEGIWYTAAHIQRLTDPNPGSTWIGDGDGGDGGGGGGGGGEPIPEPATMLLLGTGLVGLAVSQRKKFRR